MTAEAPYAIARILPLSFGESDRLVRDALQAEGFGVLTEIDVSATLKQKLDVDLPPYLILGACSPALAHRALEAEPDVGLLLPCNVVVRDMGDGQTLIEAMDPVKQLSFGESRALKPLAVEARERLIRAIGAVAS